MKLVFHAGLHRAASSSLQRLLGEERPRLERAGIAAVPQARLKHPDMAAVRAFARAPAGTPAERERLADGLSRVADHLARKGMAAILISDENMPGVMPGKRDRPFERRAALFGMLEMLARRHDVRLLLILREHASWLQSLHAFLALRGDRRSFAAFAEGFDRDELAFAPLLAEAASALGEAHVRLDSLEQVKTDGGERLLATLAGHLGDPGLARLRLSALNASPPAFLHETVLGLERRGFCFAPANRQEAMELAAAASTGGEAALQALANAMAEATVRLPLPVRGKKRMKLAQAIARHDRFGLLKPLSPPRAADLLREALAQADEDADPATAETLATIRQRFAEDRETIAANWLPEWGERLDPTG